MEKGGGDRKKQERERETEKERERERERKRESEILRWKCLTICGSATAFIYNE